MVPRSVNPHARSLYCRGSRCCRCSSPAACARAGTRPGRDADGFCGARHRFDARWRSSWRLRRHWLRRHSSIADDFGLSSRCRRRFRPRFYSATAARNCTSSQARSSSSAARRRSRPSSVSNGSRFRASSTYSALGGAGKKFRPNQYHRCRGLAKVARYRYRCFDSFGATSTAAVRTSSATARSSCSPNSGRYMQSRLTRFGRLRRTSR